MTIQAKRDEVRAMQAERKRLRNTPADDIKMQLLARADAEIATAIAEGIAMAAAAKAAPSVGAQRDLNGKDEIYTGSAWVSLASKAGKAVAAATVNA